MLYIKTLTGQKWRYLSCGDISLDNYNKVITDLIGIRIIILDKRQWRGVHEVLLKIFKNEVKALDK